MALVPIRIDRTSKPPIGTPLRSDGHWSVQGLADAFDLSQCSVGGVFGAKGTIATVSGAVAFGPYGATFSGGIISLGKIIGTTGKLTYLASASPSLLDASTDDIIVGYGDRATLRFFSTVSSHFFSYNGSTWDEVRSSGKVFTVYEWYVMAGVHSATTNKIYCDGVSVGSVSATPRNSPSPFDLTLGGEVENLGRKLTGRIAWAFIFNRDLSGAEIASLSANPWQIYEPETVWIEVGGGGEAALFAGSVYGQSSASAQLSTAVVLAAAAQGSTTAQAALSIALELAAQVNGIGSAEGTLSTAIHLIGVAAGQCGVVGRLAEPVEILAQLRVMASDPLALTISVRDPLALRVTVQ